jgi:hypothetical protein
MGADMKEKTPSPPPLPSLAVNPEANSTVLPLFDRFANTVMLLLRVRGKIVFLTWNNIVKYGS